MKAPRQILLPLRPPRTWGGARKGAGRKPGPRPGLPHRPRPEHDSRVPLHVTWRVRDHVWNLRSARCFDLIRRAFAAQRARPGFRLTHYSVQGNHLHLIVEADDRRALTRGLRGLGVWLSRRLNALMGTRGSVLADRSHQHELRTPRETRQALDYVYNNAWRHQAAKGRAVRPFYDAFSTAQWFDGWTDEAGAEMRAVLGEPTGPAPVAAARTWLLTRGWRRRGLIALAGGPGET